MNRGPWAGPWAVVAFAVLLFVAACQRGAVVEPGSFEPLPELDLSTVEEVARQQLVEHRTALDKLLRKGAEAPKLIKAFGDLGELYHAYQLLPAAAICYRNAARLDPQSFLWPYYLGVVEQSQGSFDAAIDWLEKALALRPDSATTLLRLAEIRLARGEREAASEGFSAVLAADEAFAAAAYYGLGRATDDPEAAVAHLEKAFELDPQAGVIHHPLGLALRQVGRLAEAEEHLAQQAAGELDVPDPVLERLESLARSSGALMRRGNRALMRGELEAAITAFRQAVEARPDNVEARRNLALALSRSGQVEAASGELEAAIELAGDNAWLHYDLGNLYMEKGAAEKAVTALERAVALAPDLMPAQFNLASALIGLQRHAEAQQALRKVLEREPENREARFLAATAKRATGQTTEAIAELQTLVQDQPSKALFRQGLAQMLIEAKREDEAKAVYEAGLELDLSVAEKSDLLTQLAELSWRRRRREEAVAYFRQAAQLDPSSSQVQTRLGNVLQLTGRLKEAASTFAKAVELDPRNATAWLSEGTLWILQGEYARANERLEAALEVVPEHDGVLHTLARLLATCPDPRVRDGQRALVLAQQAYSMKKTPDYAETVGMAMAELGQFEEAIRWQRALIAQAAQIGQTKLGQQMTARLRLYERRQPVRIFREGSP